jgi:hypothetical protein
VGQLAGYRDKKGYVVIEINGKCYFAHRLAWFYVTQAWPCDQIDHIDRVKHNNCFANLREATNGQNQGNIVSRNRAGLKGVTFHARLKEKPYEASLTTRTNGRRKRRSLGCYKTPEEAHQAYCAAAKEHFGEHFHP